VRLGVDLKTAQEYLGHQDIHTRMRYAHFAPDHAARSVIERNVGSKSSLPLESKPQAMNRQYGDF
jgi:hypothetical protein